MIVSNEIYAARIKAGETHLLGALIAQNKGMVHATARRYLRAAARNRGADYDDLVQAATIGLMEAVDAWDSERGAFITFAVLYMRSEILKLLGLRTSKQHIENTQPPASIYDEAYNSDDGSILIIDTVADPDAVNPCEAAVDVLTHQVIRAAVDSLPPEMCDCIKKRYFEGAPIAGINKYTFNQAMRKLRANSRIRQLRNEYESAPYRHASLTSFKSTWTSAVESAAIQREQLLARIDETISTFIGYDTAELVELREKLLKGL